MKRKWWGERPREPLIALDTDRRCKFSGSRGRSPHPRLSGLWSKRAKNFTFSLPNFIFELKLRFKKSFRKLNKVKFQGFSMDSQISTGMAGQAGPSIAVRSSMKRTESKNFSLKAFELL